MKTNAIKVGETYFFVATESAARKHLEGTPFTVYEIKPVWRRTYGKSRRVKRFFNEFGEGARAEELEPLDTQLEKTEQKLVLCMPEFDIHANCDHSTGNISDSDFKEEDELPF